jgi:hypothetical protein
LHNRFGAPGNDSFEPLRRCAERRRALRRIKRGDSSARARADVQDAPSIADGLDSQVHSLRDLGHSSTYSAGNRGIFRIDDPEDPFRGKEVDVDRARIASFGGGYLFSRISAFW